MIGEACELLVLHEWIGDATFVRSMEAFAAPAGVRVRAVGPGDLAAALADWSAGTLRPSLIVDRASDVHPDALALARLAKAAGVRVVNDPDRAEAAVDKATMHLALMSTGVNVPHTIVIRPDDALDADLGPVGVPFVVKPALGCGGEGVRLDATSAAHIARSRAERPGETFLVQQLVEWTAIDGRPAYFRALWCLGDVHVCFWDPATRIYAAIDRDPDTAPGLLAGIRGVAEAIACVSVMDLFSTEVALAPDGRIVSVDYVNDMCDLRPASQHADGVPDAVVDAIAARLVAAVQEVGR